MGFTVWLKSTRDQTSNLFWTELKLPGFMQGGRTTTLSDKDFRCVTEAL